VKNIYFREILGSKDESEDEGRTVQAREMGRAARKRARGRAVGMRRERAWTRLLNQND
jgi:hypothetical protein